jgi:hypothetical protein
MLHKVCCHVHYIYLQLFRFSVVSDGNANSISAMPSCPCIETLDNNGNLSSTVSETGPCEPVVVLLQ